MAHLRNGSPVSCEGWLQKEGPRGERFNRYMRLHGTCLSNAHSEAHAPSWKICVLTSKFGRGTRERELVVSLPKRNLSYFATCDEDYDVWVQAAERAQVMDITRYYHIGDVLGEGAFAKVHDGYELTTREPVAIKVIHKAQQDPREMEYILREMDIMMRMCHPNVVETYDVFDTMSTLYLAIEKMPGGELFDIVADKGHLSELQASQVVREIIIGCEYFHSVNIVHCDIKPENILCKSTQWPLEVKICDFGLANTIDADQANTYGGDRSMTAMIGTPGYVAPEIVKREGYGRPVDMWACGVVLYVMLSGRMPFFGRNDTECLKRTAQGEYSFPDREWKDISEDAKSLVKALLQANPAKRLTAHAALQHCWLSTPERNSAVPIENDLRGIHSSRRKFKRAVHGILTIQKMEGLLARVNEPSGE